MAFRCAALQRRGNAASACIRAEAILIYGGENMHVNRICKIEVRLTVKEKSKLARTARKYSTTSSELIRSHINDLV